MQKHAKSSLPTKVLILSGISDSTLHKKNIVDTSKVNNDFLLILDVFPTKYLVCFLLVLYIQHVVGMNYV